MTTRKFYPFADGKPLPNRIQFKPTHKVTRRDGSTFEVNTTPEFIAKWQERLGWTAVTLVEDRTVRNG